MRALYVATVFLGVMIGIGLTDCGGRLRVPECQDAGVLCTLNQKLVCCPSGTSCGPVGQCPANYCCPPASDAGSQDVEQDIYDDEDVVEASMSSGGNAGCNGIGCSGGGTGGTPGPGTGGVNIP